MYLKNKENCLVFSENLLGSLKKPNLISKPLQGYFHSLICSHTLKILLHQEYRTANQIEGFFMTLLSWECSSARKRAEYLLRGPWQLVELFQMPRAERANFLRVPTLAPIRFATLPVVDNFKYFLHIFFFLLLFGLYPRLDIT